MFLTSSHHKYHKSSHNSTILRNTSMVERHQLRRIIEETVQRHAAIATPPAVESTAVESTDVIATPVARQDMARELRFLGRKAFGSTVTFCIIV